MAKSRDFLKQFWQEKKMVGSMVPSSRFLAEKMLQNVDFKHAKVFVELGPGNGVFTKHLLARMNPDAKLLVFELNIEFYNQLLAEIQDERVVFINDSAEKIQDYLNQHDILCTDYIISSLPLANFPNKLKTDLIEASYNALKNEGKYIQFQYTLNAKKKLEEKFDRVHLAFTPLNLPPAFVYTCIKEK